jgi:acyl dehydratase
VSQYLTITESDVVAFASWSWDTNPVHTDAMSASTGRFGERIAHGLLGLSVAMGLVSRLGVFEQCSIALLGVDGWTFSAPILLGDSVRCELEITGVRAASNGVSGVLERTLVLTNQDGVRVQSGQINLLVSTRPGG